MVLLLKNIMHLVNNCPNTYNDKSIHLEDNNNINYWLKKLGVNKEKLNDAILYTGSINIGDIKLYLTKNKKTYLPFAELYHSIKKRSIFHN